MERVNIYMKQKYFIYQRLKNYSTSWKVAGSRNDEVNNFFCIYLILLAAVGPVVYSTSNRNEYQKQKNKVSEE
jgi:hypothetical protein